MPSERSKWYADRLRELLERHNVKPPEVEKRTATDGHAAPVAAVTVRRILKAEARHEPDRRTLERIAAAFGEDPRIAFPQLHPSSTGTLPKAYVHFFLERDPVDPDLLNMAIHTGACFTSAIVDALESNDAKAMAKLERVSRKFHSPLPFKSLVDVNRERVKSKGK